MANPLSVSQFRSGRHDQKHAMLPLAKFDAVLFDLDGTLIDCERQYGIALAGAVRQRGGRLDARQGLAYCFGRSWTDIHEAVAAEHAGLFGCERDLVAAVRDHCREHGINMHAPILPSVRALRRFAARIPVAIVSGSSRKHIAENILMLGISEQLEFFLGYEDYGKGKPDPTCYRLAAKMLRVKPMRCLVIEDSAVGVRAAKAAGMSCIALAPKDGYPQDLSQADLIVEHLGQLDIEQTPGESQQINPQQIKIVPGYDPPARRYSSARPPTE